MQGMSGNQLAQIHKGMFDRIRSVRPPLGHPMPLEWCTRKQHCTATHTLETVTVCLAEAEQEVNPLQDVFRMALNLTC